MAVLVKVIAWICAVCVWAILGFYVWVPSLVIVILLYVSGALVASTGSDKFLRFSERKLESVAPLYSDGFIRITSGVWKPSQEGEVGAGVAWVVFLGYLCRAAFHLLVASLVWCLLFSLATHFLGWPGSYLDRLGELGEALGLTTGNAAGD
jgi:hypothetical protein